MNTTCCKNIGIFSDEKAIDVLTKEGYRVTSIGKDVEALMNRVVNPKSKLCRYTVLGNPSSLIPEQVLLVPDYRVDALDARRPLLVTLLDYLWPPSTFRCRNYRSS
ncbi:hypothetical protein PTT_11461 [Pyrenophora teres f. teres 0-1]|uniref:Uncharacterized protein n=1 Tax=Pyrenophora teres f. teres (strain 0-1) TaxID=861557 RepID=E3RRL1_PYRTT|nr:hypothetical protein PTT_11461 [Pyrenophora teres f. teres 0-1]